MSVVNRKQRERGGALIMVLWAALLLSVILAGALATARIEAQTAAAQSDQLRARQAALSALEIAAIRIAQEGDEASSDLFSQSLDINGYQITLEPALQSRQLDINLANEAAFSALLTSFNVDEDEANILAARIADWRDEDDLSRPNGAEARDYARAQNGQRIENRRFKNINELKLVLGFPASLYDCLVPSLTVIGTSGDIDKTLKQVDTENTTTRRLATAGRTTAAGRRYAITATATSQAGTSVNLTSLFRVTGARDKPFEVISIFNASLSVYAVKCSLIK